MKKLILISALIAFATTASAAILPNQSTPAATMETFLRALQRLDGEGIWSVMSGKLKDEFSKEFNELKKDGELEEFAEEFGAPYLRESRDAHQFMVNLFQAARQAYPEECAELARVLSDESIRSLLDSGKLEVKDNKAYLEIEELGEISLVKEGPNWKIAELDGFDIFDF
jgi:Skp family chaperone for outer membrane proteins